jgi:hypothetical protein
VNAVVDYQITCGACPFQVEGTLEDGRHFYFRYRSSQVRIGLGVTREDAIKAAMYSPAFADRSDVEGHNLGGVMDDTEFAAYMGEFLAVTK